MRKWWHRHWRWAIAALAIVSGGILVLILYATKKSAEAAQLRADLVLMNAKLKVDGLEADKRSRIKSLQANKEEAQKVSAEIIEAKKKAVALVKAVDGMTNTEVVMEFKTLGYM